MGKIERLGGSIPKGKWTVYRGENRIKIALPAAEGGGEELSHAKQP